MNYKQFHQSPRYSTTVSGRGISQQRFQLPTTVLQTVVIVSQCLYTQLRSVQLKQHRQTAMHKTHIYATNSEACELASNNFYNRYSHGISDAVGWVMGWVIVPKIIFWDPMQPEAAPETDR